MCRGASFRWILAVWVDMIKEPASRHVLAVAASYFRKLRIDFERLEFFFHAFRIDEFRNTDFKTPRLIKGAAVCARGGASDSQNIINAGNIVRPL